MVMWPPIDDDVAAALDPQLALQRLDDVQPVVATVVEEQPAVGVRHVDRDRVRERGRSPRELIRETPRRPILTAAAVTLTTPTAIAVGNRIARG